MLPLCRDQKIAVIPYSPMAKGLLTRKPAKERDETPHPILGYSKKKLKLGYFLFKAKP